MSISSNNPHPTTAMIYSKSDLRNLTYKINGAAIEVHKHLGPGLLESIYHECMKHELRLRGLNFLSEMNIPIHYKGINMATNLRCDLYVEECIVVELKSVKAVDPYDEAKLMTYMKLLNAPKGIMFNFNVAQLYPDGQKTYVNQLFNDLGE